MAKPRKVFLITECYSTKNLGDAELVDATIERVSGLDEDASIELVALDSASFKVNHPTFTIHSRLFDRRMYSSRSSFSRLLLVVVWLGFLIVQTAIALVPNQRARLAVAKRSLVLCPNFMRSTVRAYIAASGIFAVGGGYMGDRYFRESVLTAWTWWWAGRCGVSVTTMPISLEANGRMLRLAFSRLLGAVSLNVRDEASLIVAGEMGLTAELLPDLAFRNTCSSLPRRTRVISRKLLIVPVGGDYFDDALWMGQLERIAKTLLSDYPDWSIELFAMHSALDGANAGYDEQAVDYLSSLMPGSNVLDREQFPNYSDLCAYLWNNVDLVISARMHAVIASLCASVPVVVLGYEEKHRSLMSTLGMADQYASFGAVSEVELGQLTAKALERSPEDRSSAVKAHRSTLDEWTVL